MHIERELFREAIIAKPTLGELEKMYRRVFGAFSADSRESLEYLTECLRGGGIQGVDKQILLLKRRGLEIGCVVVAYLRASNSGFLEYLITDDTANRMSVCERLYKTAEAVMSKFAERNGKALDKVFMDLFPFPERRDEGAIKWILGMIGFKRVGVSYDRPDLQNATLLVKLIDRAELSVEELNLFLADYFDKYFHATSDDLARCLIPKDTRGFVTLTSLLREAGL